MKKYFLVWLKASELSIQANLAQRGGSVMFMLGKFIRFASFIILLSLISGGVKKATGYTLQQMINFFLFFNLFDLIGQLFFRGIYWFRGQIISGEFDFMLLKPIAALFQVLSRHTDILDLPLLLVVSGYLLTQAVGMPVVNLFIFTILAISGGMIVTAVHIFVAALGVITTEVDHTIMIYRDLSSMARVPTDIYALPIKFLLTFIIPVSIAYTVPAKAFMGILEPNLIFISPTIGIIFFLSSLKFWQYALTKYSSASS